MVSGSACVSAGYFLHLLAPTGAYYPVFCFRNLYNKSDGHQQQDIGFRQSSTNLIRHCLISVMRTGNFVSKVVAISIQCSVLIRLDQIRLICKFRCKVQRHYTRKNLILNAPVMSYDITHNPLSVICSKHWGHSKENIIKIFCSCNNHSLSDDSTTKPRSVCLQMLLLSIDFEVCCSKKVVVICIKQSYKRIYMDFIDINMYVTHN